MSKLSKDQKKGLHQKWTLFSPISSGDLGSDAYQSQIIEGDADEDHTQIIGGDISPPSRVSAPLPDTVPWVTRLLEHGVKRITVNLFPQIREIVEQCLGASLYYLK